MKTVKIRWKDATHVEDEQTEYQLLNRKVIEFVTVGLLIADKPDRVIVSGSRTTDDDGIVYKDSLVLPKEFVLNISELGETGKITEITTEINTKEGKL